VRAKKITLVIAVAASVAAALTSASLAAPSTGTSATVGVQRTNLGRILVDGHGHTLYLFEKDKRGKSSCNGACATAWPPLIASGKPRAGSGVRATLLGRTKRKDGRWQVTYNRHPLYTFVQDTNEGQTNGEGVDAFGAEWYAVSPAGAKAEENNPVSSSGGDPSSGGYGGYGGYSFGVDQAMY
jgi:predicted lipoprotein with Yx(FWY)xxD motif